MNACHAELFIPVKTPATATIETMMPGVATPAVHTAQIAAAKAARHDRVATRIHRRECRSASEPPSGPPTVAPIKLMNPANPSQVVDPVMR